MQLIINADDFGYSKGQNFGIIDCLKNGSVTSTTLLTTTGGTHHAFELIKQNPTIDVGIHLSLDIGTPILGRNEIPSLLDHKGQFRKYDLKKETLGINPDEVYLEWKAQIQYAIDHGVKPTHIDSHHHLHMKEDVFPTFVQIAKEFNLAIRFHPRDFNQEKKTRYLKQAEGLIRADTFTSGFYDDGVSLEFFEALKFEEGKVIEVMCHPAFIDLCILNNSSYSYPRAIEQNILSSKELDNLLEARGIKLTTYKALLDKTD